MKVNALDLVLSLQSGCLFMVSKLHGPPSRPWKVWLNRKPSIVENIVSENLTCLDTSISLNNHLHVLLPPKNLVCLCISESALTGTMILSALINVARENADNNPFSKSLGLLNHMSS